MLLSSSGIFVTGTDTNVGKTWVSTLLVAALKKKKIPVGYFKPVQTGLDSDTAQVRIQTGLPEEDAPPPAYFFPQPMAPARAASLANDGAGVQIQLDSIFHYWKNLPNFADRWWVVEGAGGLMVPLNSKHVIRDLIGAFGLKTLVVSSTRLGTINHTLLTLEAAKAAGVDVVGVVLNGQDDPGLEKVIEDYSNVPVIANVPNYQPHQMTSCQDVQVLAEQVFSSEVLRRICGREVS
jgi:dethiobiotin synthase